MTKRLKLTIKSLEGETFLYNSYYEELVKQIINLIGTEYVGISSILTKKPVETDEGIWIVKYGTILLCSPFWEKCVNLLHLLKSNIILQNKHFQIARMQFYKQETLKKGLLLSGVYAKYNGEYLQYEKSPEIFSEALRQNLIEIFIKKYNIPPIDKRFFFTLNKGFRKNEYNDVIAYKGIYNIFGSEELCNLFTELFVTGILKNH